MLNRTKTIGNWDHGVYDGDMVKDFEESLGLFTGIFSSPSRKPKVQASKHSFSIPIPLVSAVDKKRNDWVRTTWPYKLTKYTPLNGVLSPQEVIVMALKSHICKWLLNAYVHSNHNHLGNDCKSADWLELSRAHSYPMHCICIRAAGAALIYMYVCWWFLSAHARPVVSMSTWLAVGTVNGRGQLKCTICDAHGPCQRNRSILKPVVRWFQQVHCAYELLRYLDLERWRFSWWRQTDCFTPCACVFGVTRVPVTYDRILPLPCTISNMQML